MRRYHVNRGVKNKKTSVQRVGCRAEKTRGGRRRNDDNIHGEKISERRCQREKRASSEEERTKFVRWTCIRGERGVTNMLSNTSLEHPRVAI